jgi:hypothetical protein
MPLTVADIEDAWIAEQDFNEWMSELKQTLEQPVKDVAAAKAWTVAQETFPPQALEYWRSLNPEAYDRVKQRMEAIHAKRNV